MNVGMESVKLKKQMRGDELDEAIIASIKQLAKEAGKQGLSKINLTQIAALVGTSRTTLYKKSEFIDECIAKVKSERRLANGSVERERLEHKVQMMQSDIDGLEQKLQALREHHAQLYRRLYANSSDLADLVKPIVIAESVEAGACTLCGHEFQNGHGPEVHNKVVKMTKSDG
jgi:hypothetical protein